MTVKSLCRVSFFQIFFLEMGKGPVKWSKKGKILKIEEIFTYFLQEKQFYDLALKETLYLMCKESDSRRNFKG